MSYTPFSISRKAHRRISWVRHRYHEQQTMTEPGSHAERCEASSIHVSPPWILKLKQEADASIPPKYHCHASVTVEE